MKLPETDELIRIGGAVAVTAAVVGLAAMFFIWVFDEHESGAVARPLRGTPKAEVPAGDRPLI